MQRGLLALTYGTLPRAAFATSLYSLAFLATVYRIFVRIRIQRWGWDDTCAMIAALSALGLFATLWVSVSEGTIRVIHQT
jgi:hypothetical protein